MATTSPAQSEDASPALLTQTDQIRSVSNWDLRNPPALDLVGTITAIDPAGRFFTLEDRQGAVAIHSDRPLTGLRVGESLHFQADAGLPLLTPLPKHPWFPDHSELIPSFDTPTHRFDLYVARTRGFLIPPSTGDYTFWIASDDGAELWLGSDERPQSARLIAQNEGWTLPKEWDKYPLQKSSAIRLEAGRRYYVETAHEQRGGIDHLSVAWAGPQFSQQLVSGESLRPWSLPSESESSPRSGLTWEVWPGQFIDGPWWLSHARPFEGALLTYRSRWNIVRNSEALTPRTFSAGQVLKQDERYRLSSVIGRVSFVGHDRSNPEVELIDGLHSVRVHLGEWKGELPHDLKDRLVRVTGVALPRLNEKAEPVLAAMLVADQDGLEILESVPRSESLPLVPLHSLRERMNHDRSRGFVRIAGEIAEMNHPRRIAVRDRGVFRASYSKEGQVWSPLGPAIELNMAPQAVAGLAVNSNSNYQSATATYDRVQGLPPLPGQTSIGSTSKSGDLVFFGSQKVVRGLGSQIWGLHDQFHFVHEAVKGEYQLRAELRHFESPDGEAKTGLMFRENLEPGAQYVDLVYTNNHGLALQWRQLAQGVITRSVPGPRIALPVWLDLRREVSSVSVDLAQAGAWQLGQWVEIVGRPEKVGDSIRLVEAEVREPTGESNLNRGGSYWPTLTTAQLVQEPTLLTNLDIFKLRGSVRFAGSYGGKSLLAIQDETGGIFVNTSLLNPKYLPEPGQYVELQSTPGWRGGRRAELTVDNVLVLGPGVEPRPLRHPLQYALPKRGAGIWTESVGIVRSVLGDERVSIKDQGEIYTAYIQGASRTQLEKWVDRTVRLRGVTYFPTERDLVLLVASASQVEFQGEPLPPPFQRELRRISDFEPTWLINQSNHRVRLSGTVLYAVRNELIIHDGAASAKVRVVDGDIPALGQRVEVVGFPDADDQRLLVVSEASIQASPAMAPAAAIGEFKNAEEGTLARARVRLLAREELENQVRLTVATEDEAFYAYWDTGLGALPQWPVESLLELTGIKVTYADRFPSSESLSGVRGPLAPSLQLRSLAEITLVQKPRWWVVKRTLLITGGIGALALLALWRLQHLRTRVAQRTQELNQAMARLSKETQMAATLAERNRLAGEIHDSMEQGLNALLLQIDSTAKKPDCPPSIRAGLAIARNMVTFNRAEVKHAVWDLQSPLLEDKDLPHALQELIHQLNPEKPRIQFSVTGQVRELPPRHDHHILRIVQEALTNAIKHSESSEVTLHVHYDASELTVSVRDDGKGFQPASVLTGGVGHFGLRSLRGRAAKIDGHLSIQSEPGQGTQVLVRVPLTHL